MPTADQCKIYAAEYRLLGRGTDISAQCSTALKNISPSWTMLANQFDRLADILREEAKSK
jgi:hypothetical protein